MQKFLKLKITSKNNGFLYSYNIYYKDQLLKPHRALVQLL